VGKLVGYDVGHALLLVLRGLFTVDEHERLAESDRAPKTTTRSIIK